MKKIKPEIKRKPY